MELALVAEAGAKDERGAGSLIRASTESRKGYKSPLGRPFQGLNLLLKNR